jgi:hypothetical protein
LWLITKNLPLIAPAHTTASKPSNFGIITTKQHKKCNNLTETLMKLTISMLQKILEFLTEMRMAYSISDAIGNGHAQSNRIGNEIYTMEYSISN